MNVKYTIYKMLKKIYNEIKTKQQYDVVPWHRAWWCVWRGLGKLHVYTTPCTATMHRHHAWPILPVTESPF